MAALDRLRTATEPMIVLLDQLMPHMHGEEVLQVLAQDPPNALVFRHFFVLMTAGVKLGELQQRLSAFSMFQTKLLIKPFELDELLAAVQHAQEAIFALQPVAPPLDADG